MSRFRVWPVASWDRGYFADAPPEDRVLMLAIALGPYSTLLPGVSVAGWAAMAEAAAVSDFPERVARLQESQLIGWDRPTRLWLVPEFLDTATPFNPNQVKSWRRFFDHELTASDVRQQIDQGIRSALINHGRANPAKEVNGPADSPWAFIKAWDSTFDERQANLHETFSERSGNVQRMFPQPSETLPERSRSEKETGSEPGSGSVAGRRLRK